MNKLLWLVAGIALGAAAAKQIQENPQAKKAYEEAKAALQEFSDAVADGYKERESELSKPRKKAAPKTARKTATKSSPRTSPKKPATKPKTTGK